MQKLKSTEKFYLPTLFLEEKERMSDAKMMLKKVSEWINTTNGSENKQHLE